MSGPFACDSCGNEFDLPPAVTERYPDWVPRQCLACRKPATGSAGKRRPSPRRTVTATRTLSPQEVLERFHEGPDDGVFTDGGSRPNPGPGGWGAVWVRDGQVVAERSGSDPDTTNNRMELTAIIEGLRLLPEDAEVSLFTDSQLCQRTLTEWAPRWERAGWKRRTGPVENVDLVKQGLAILRTRPKVRIQWVRAHSGWRWNEYADALASAQLPE